MPAGSTTGAPAGTNSAGTSTAASGQGVTPQADNRVPGAINASMNEAMGAGQTNPPM
jgi:hypothetical protein